MRGEARFVTNPTRKSHGPSKKGVRAVCRHGTACHGLALTACSNERS